MMTLEEFDRLLTDIVKEYTDNIYVVDAHEDDENCPDLYDVAKSAVEGRFHAEIENLYHEVLKDQTFTTTVPIYYPTSDDWWNHGTTITCSSEGSESVSK